MAGHAQKSPVEARGERCGTRECICGCDERLATFPNALTILRLVAATSLIGLGLHQHDSSVLLVALAVYWVGDSLDGLAARTLNQETRAGATFDILCDRVGCATFYMAWASLHPSTLIPVLLYLVHFMVIDMQLSLAFLQWPIRSPNYLYAVDRTVWRLNYSVPAKLANGTLVAIALLLIPIPLVACLLVAALAAVKVWSHLHLYRTRPALEHSCISPS